MAAFSDYLEDAVLEHVLGGSSLAQPTPYAALFTAAPNDAGGGTEVTGGAYARVATGAFSSTSGTADNDADIEFPEATANWGTITHFGIFDASSGGNLLVHGALDSSVSIETGDVFRFNAGDLDVSLD